MSPESEVIIYAMQSMAQFLAKEGVISEPEFIEHMKEAEYKLRKSIGTAPEAQALIGNVFDVITSQIDNE
ncbi:hypothetical protein [Acinetobacter pollinis]|uniref:hypothetical protein n=1 Tax=Acinetobacter pollinis TaxID=2605270 RepID=UPI0018C2AC0A|nr:hypothetical protein [Acinetobacter pollinis]MBF7694171.1 hypothetical protein [Acinetobacter pollinis]MBF7701754.1 hypothetical protein [Acinetobacter pollinis]